MSNKKNAFIKMKEVDMNLKNAVVFFVLLFFVHFFLNAQTSPEEFLGHKVGADRKLADYNQIQAYFQKLDQESGKLKVLTIGQTTLGKPMIMVVISSEKNTVELDKYREINKKLRDARGLTDEDAKQLAKEGKVVVLISCNIHPYEIGSSQESMELAHRLVTGNTPFDADKVLDKVIVLLIPSAAPDGQQMVTEWYRKTLGTPYEGNPMPWIDAQCANGNNRDWVTFNLPETKVLSRVLFHDWLPQIHDDKHQMGPDGPRCFVPPFIDPADPNIHPLIYTGIDLLGANMANDLQKNGFKGVEHARHWASAWWKGSYNGTAMVHNTIGIFSEMASVRIATPIYIDPTELDETLHTKSLLMPNPWPGGWWRLRDIVDYELINSLSLLRTAYLHKENFLYNYYKMCKDSIEDGKKGDPFAFIFPQKQSDYPTTLRMLDILKFGGAEIHQAQEPYVADGKNYPKGSFVILMSQPYRPYVKGILEERKYPDILQYPGGIAVSLLDNASHTLPMQMGVSFSEIKKPFEAKLSKLESIPYPAVTPPPASSPYIVLDSRVNASYSVVFALLGENAEAYRTEEKIKGEGFKAAVGSFIIKNSSQVQKALPALLEKWHLTAYPIEDITEIPKAPLKNPRIGLFQSWSGTEDEAWTRVALNDLEISFTSLHNKDFKNSKGKIAVLREKVDVIIFADEKSRVIKSGANMESLRFSGTLPPEYQGGIEDEGIEALKNFVEQGGIVVSINNSCNFLLKEFEVPARNILEGVPWSEFFASKSLVKIKVDNKSPIGYGMPKEAAAMFAQSTQSNRASPGLAFSTSPVLPVGWERKIVASYAEDNVLLRGWISGEDKIARRATVIDAKYKKGHFILIGFLCQHRAQTRGTYKFLLNALLYPQVD
jgi:hypothetical protein